MVVLYPPNYSQHFKFFIVYLLSQQLATMSVIVARTHQLPLSNAKQ